MKNSISRKLIFIEVAGIILVLLAVGAFGNFLNEDGFRQKVAHEVEASTQALAHGVKKLESDVSELGEAIRHNKEIASGMLRISNATKDHPELDETKIRMLRVLQLMGKPYHPYTISLYDTRGKLIVFFECPDGECMMGYVCTGSGEEVFYRDDPMSGSFIPGTPPQQLPLSLDMNDQKVGTVLRSIKDNGLLVEKTIRFMQWDSDGDERSGYIRTSQIVDYQLLNALSEGDAKVELIMGDRVINRFSQTTFKPTIEGVKSLYYVGADGNYHIDDDYVTYTRLLLTQDDRPVYFNIGVKLDELRAARAQVNTSVVIFLLVTLLVVAPVTVLIIRSLINRPLEELITATTRLRQGEAPIPMVLKSRKDEIGEVARAIDALAETVRVSEHELRELNSNLQEAVDKRTREYLSAKEDAEAASRAKSAFLATMSHEIRTPLNAIMGFINLLREDEKDPERLKYISTIKRSSDSLLGIINDILDFAKIESGRMEIETIDANLHQELNDVGSMFFVKAHEKGAHFHFYVDPTLPRIITIDLLRYRQVLINLLGNALKFTDAGKGVYVSITFDSDAETVTTSVRDEGIGIDAKQQRQIFDSFSQAEGSIARRFGGTGLGLAISKRLVNLMGGDLHVRSRLGQGSDFYFTIPAPVRKGKQPFVLQNIVSGDNLPVYLSCPAEDVSYEQVLDEYLRSFGITRIHHFDESALPQEKALFVVNSTHLDDPRIVKLIQSGQRSIIIKCTPMEELDWVARLSNCVIIDPPFTPSNLFDGIARLFYRPEDVDRAAANAAPIRHTGFCGHILVAEDNEDNRYLIRVMLERLGLSHVFAHNGLSALDAVRSDHFDLILMDENMPVMSGSEAARRIRDMESTLGGHTPIVALTANAIKGDRERFLQSGMDDYLSKPINQEELLRVLRRFLRPAPCHPEDGAAKKPATQPMEEGIVIDAVIKAKELEFDPEDIRELVGIFIKNRPENLEGLRIAIERRDYSAIFEAAHKIKSSASALVIQPIIETAGQIEMAARKNEKLDYTTWFERLNDQVMAVAIKGA